MQNNPDGENKLEFATWQRRLIPIIVGGIGLAMIVGGIVFEYINQTRSVSNLENSANAREFDKIVENKQATVAGVNTLVKVRTIKIDVSGSVMKPGVVEIPYDSRIQDVLITAGGLSPKADRTYVSRNINLAQKVADGSKIYIPAIGEVKNITKLTQGELVNSANTNSTLVNINSASEAQLDSLSGIGSVTAGKIILGRPYQDVSELTSKKIVGVAVFEKIKDKISIY